ncbi:MAG TPA: zinc ribbon domain-containing protein [Pirellulaceae bacterium]|nr:zinc ribbon domain-containing protein [Pirellulaceae bacterium]
MPTYDYECDACDHRFDAFQTMSAEPLKKCPKCGKRKLRRLFGAGAGLIFKGSGFYLTDYRSESYKQAAAADKPASSESSSSSTESKAASKPAEAKASEPTAKSPPKSPPKDK